MALHRSALSGFGLHCLAALRAGLLAASVAATGLAGAAPLLMPAPALAQSEPQSILSSLSREDRAFLGKAEDWLNGVDTYQAQFLQISSTGNYAEGTLKIDRPGLMRLEYDPPTPLLLIANGSHLVYYDKELDQVSYISQDSTPLGILLKEQVSFDDPALTVIDMQRAGGVVEISVVQTNDPGQGILTLVFTETPIRLAQWRVRDAQNVEVTVSLFGPKRDIPLDPDLFQFRESERPSRMQ